VTNRSATVARLRARLAATSRRTRIAAALAALFIIAVAIGFHPEVQKKLVIRFAGPLFEQLEFERIHILPWSVTLERFRAGYAGATFSGDTFAARFCLSSLIGHTVEVKTLSARGITVDLREFAPPPSPPPTGPFPGVFASLDHGFDIELHEVNIDAYVQVSASDMLTLTVTGGDIAPDTAGALAFTGRYTAQATDTVDFSGNIELDQLDRGRFKAIAVSVDSGLRLATLPQPEHVRLAVTLRPTADPTRRTITSDDGEVHFEPQPESITVKLFSHDGLGGARAEFGLNALYDGLNGTLAGPYTLTSTDRLVAPYTDSSALPGFTQSAEGHLFVDTQDGSITANLDSHADITDLQRVLGPGSQLPSRVSLEQRIAVKLADGTLEISRLDNRLIDDEQNTVIASALAQSLSVPLDDPLALLAREQQLLTLDVTELPLGWLDGMAPEVIIRGTVAATRFELSSDADAVVRLVPTAPMIIDGIAIEHGGTPLADGLRLALSPRIVRDDSGLHASLDDLTASSNELAIAAVKLTANMPAATDGTASTDLQLSGRFDIDPLLQQPGFTSLLTDVSLPQALSLHIDGKLKLAGDTIRIRALKARFSQPDRDDLVRAEAKQTFTIKTSDDGAQINNPAGELAAVSISDLDLAWLSPFLDPYTISGRVSQAAFSLQAQDGGALVLSANAPLRLSSLNVANAGEPMLDNIWASVQPTIEYAPARTVLRYEGLRISGGKRQIAGGAGEVTLTPRPDQAPEISADGELEIAVNALGGQPLIAATLSARDYATSLETNFRYRVKYTGEVIELERLKLDLSLDKTRYLGVESESGLTIRPQLEAGDNLARHAVGEIRLDIDALSAAALGDVLPMSGIAFDRIDGIVRLRSDGERLVARSDESLQVRNVRITDPDGVAVLKPFDVTTSATVEAVGQTLDLALDSLAINFHGNDQPGLHGSLSARIEPERTIALQRLRADFTGDVPQLLDHPGVLPGHALTNGTLGMTIAVEPDGNITAKTLLDGLASRETLAIHTIAMPLTGNMRPDGRGFDISMPLIGTGKSGVGNALIVGEYLPVKGEPSTLRLQISSELFYLNDMLAAIDGISRPAPARAPATAGDKSADKAAAAPIVLDETADTAAFWDVLPYTTEVEFDFRKLFYSDYLAFNDIKGSAELTRKALVLNAFGARFHDSPITLDGGLTFTAGEAAPYSAKLRGKIADFDLNQFFTELTPNEESRIEGLFSVDIAIDGTSPNAAQFRNRLLLDLKMNSRDGLFRPLPAGGTLMAGASDALGIVGEGLSYVPTGGFGAGAVSRLVNYIAVIDYDVIDIHITRDTSLDLVIKRFNMLSPNIRMSAKGAIAHEYGKDIIDSPLDVIAHLNMTGKGAAILYSIDLLEDEQDKYGYWKGPEFRISGSVAATESNFAEIIERASDGAIKGGITRPLSGFIGNIKYRWFGNDGEAEAAAQDAGDVPAAAQPGAPP